MSIVLVHWVCVCACECVLMCDSQGALPAPTTSLPFAVMRFGSCSNRIKHVKCSLCLYAWRVIEMCCKCVCVLCVCVHFFAMTCAPGNARFTAQRNGADNIAVFYASSLCHLFLIYAIVSFLLLFAEFMPLQFSIDFRLAPTTDWGWNTKHIERIWY